MSRSQRTGVDAVAVTLTVSHLNRMILAPTAHQPAINVDSIHREVNSPSQPSGLNHNLGGKVFIRPYPLDADYTAPSRLMLGLGLRLLGSHAVFFLPTLQQLLPG